MFQKSLLCYNFVLGMFVRYANGPGLQLEINAF